MQWSAYFFRIEVKSKFGQGTTFSIYLPKKKAKSLRKA